MPNDEDAVWFRIIEPPYQSTGGIAQTMYCLVCGSAIIILRDDVAPSEIHINYHTARGERPDAEPAT